MKTGGRDCATPVSYTHLDVYKRQPLNLPTGVFRPGAGLTIEAAPIEGATYKTIFTLSLIHI